MLCFKLCICQHPSAKPALCLWTCTELHSNSYRCRNHRRNLSFQYQQVSRTFKFYIERHRSATQVRIRRVSIDSQNYKYCWEIIFFHWFFSFCDLDRRCNKYINHNRVYGYLNKLKFCQLSVCPEVQIFVYNPPKNRQGSTAMSRNGSNKMLRGMMPSQPRTCMQPISVLLADAGMGVDACYHWCC